MKTVNIAAMALMLMYFLSACQSSEQGASTKVAGRTTIDGPSDGGGGDTCNGKMIESFRVDITELAEYKDYVQPIMKKLVSKDGNKTTSPFVFSPK